MEKICKYCGNPFNSVRKTALFCCSNHRVLHFIKHKESDTVTEPKKVNTRAMELAAETGCLVAADMPKPLMTHEQVVNEKIGRDVAEFCNKHNCTLGDLTEAYLASLKPIRPKANKAIDEEKPKSSAKGYDRRASKLGF